MAAVFKPSPLGILRCRELVTLYYGFPIVTDVREMLAFGLANGSGLLLQPDPRRIRYEIWISNSDVNELFTTLAKSLDGLASTRQEIITNSFNTTFIQRTFLTDMDAVTLPVYYATTGNNWQIATRETFLTPAPVDEVPLP